MILEYPSSFKILSTRNKESIKRTLEYFERNVLEIYGQEDIRVYGSKLEVAYALKWFKRDDYLVYIYDMNSHLEPFEKHVDLCIQAGWGYDFIIFESYTKCQTLKIINALFSRAYGKLNT